MKSNEIISLLNYIIEDLKTVDAMNFSETCEGAVVSLEHVVDKLIQEKVEAIDPGASDVIIHEMSSEDFDKIQEILNIGSQNFEEYEKETSNEASSHLSLVVDNDNPNFKST